VQNVTSNARRPHHLDSATLTFKEKIIADRQLTKMITNEEKEYIKTNLKWKFNWADFTRYFIIVGPIGITFIAFSMFYGGFKFGHIYNNNFINPFFFTASCGLLLGLFFTYFTIRRIETERKFQTMQLSNNISFADIADKIQAIKWTIIGKGKDVIQVSTKISLFSWGECVTIVKGSDNHILINSQPFGRQPFTLNRDKVNFKKLKDALT